MGDTIDISQQAANNWAEVELYRWQHGNLPGEPGTKLLPSSPSEGLRGMAAAIEKRDMSNFPDPFNVMTVLRYAAHLLDEKSKVSIVQNLDAKVGRNNPCPCHSGKKFKQCCGSPNSETNPAEAVSRLDLSDKQSIVDLMFSVQGGYTSCQRAASEIQARSQKKAPDELTDSQIMEWADRHNFQGSLRDLRCAFEDAKSLKPYLGT